MAREWARFASSPPQTSSTLRSGYMIFQISIKCDTRGSFNSERASYESFLARRANVWVPCTRFEFLSFSRTCCFSTNRKRIYFPTHFALICCHEIFLSDMMGTRRHDIVAKSCSKQGGWLRLVDVDALTIHSQAPPNVLGIENGFRFIFPASRYLMRQRSGVCFSQPLVEWSSGPRPNSPWAWVSRSRMRW